MALGGTQNVIAHKNYTLFIHARWFRMLWSFFKCLHFNRGMSYNFCRIRLTCGQVAPLHTPVDLCIAYIFVSLFFLCSFNFPFPILVTIFSFKSQRSHSAFGILSICLTSYMICYDSISTA